MGARWKRNWDQVKYCSGVLPPRIASVTK
ncbi:DUF2256 domain-containing protein [Massilia sp. GER05]